MAMANTVEKNQNFKKGRDFTFIILHMVLCILQMVYFAVLMSDNVTLVKKNQTYFNNFVWTCTYKEFILLYVIINAALTNNIMFHITAIIIVSKAAISCLFIVLTVKDPLNLAFKNLVILFSLHLVQCLIALIHMIYSGANSNMYHYLKVGANKKLQTAHYFRKTLKIIMEMDIIYIFTKFVYLNTFGNKDQFYFECGTNVFSFLKSIMVVYGINSENIRQRQIVIVLGVIRQSYGLFSIAGFFKQQFYDGISIIELQFAFELLSRDLFKLFILYFIIMDYKSFGLIKHEPRKRFKI